MKEVTPYKTLTGALRALDNGGRFFNLFTHAGDGEIEGSEVSKASGRMAGKSDALLFFMLAISQLTDTEQATLIDHLSEGLRSHIQEAGLGWVPVHRFHQSASLHQPILLEGFPFFIKDRTQLTSFVPIPITTNNVTTMMMVPVFERFDVYEVFGHADGTGRKALVALPHAKQKKTLEPRRTSFAGKIKEMVLEPKKTKKPFVEVCYMLKHA